MVFVRQRLIGRVCGIVASAAVLFAAAVARADTDLPVPAPPKGDVLRIPGLPPVDLPPGAKVFGPHGPAIGGAEPSRPALPQTRPSTRGEPPKSAGPPTDKADGGVSSLPKVSDEAARAGVLDQLFKQLADASDADEAKSVAAAIQSVWSRSGSDTADLLMGRAVAAMGAGQSTLALELLDHVVEIAPDWAEAWNKRATVRFMADDYDGSMADIDRTLALEPRHWGALSGLATILQRSGYDKRALDVLRRALAIYPQQQDVKKLLDRLVPEIEGRDI